MKFLQLLFSIAGLKMDLHDAVEKGNLGRVKLLIEQGADKDKSDSYGDTPLRTASFFGRHEVVQYLVEQGASLDKGDNQGQTPLTAASVFGYLEIVRCLLEQGANRDKADNNGNTPLHKAAGNGRLEIAMLLMSYGADLNARNNRSQLPIDVATTEKIKQAIRDEPRRRMDEAPGKRATEQDRHPNTATSSSVQQEGDENDEEQPRNKRPRLDEGAVAQGEETKVAEEDEDSEPSSDEDDH